MTLHFGLFGFDAGEFEFGANQKAYGGNEPDLAFGVMVGLAMLEVDDSDDFTAAEDGDREEGLVEVLQAGRGTCGSVDRWRRGR